MAEWTISLNEGAEKILDAVTGGGDEAVKTGYLNHALEILLVNDADETIKNSKVLLIEKINAVKSLDDLRLMAKSIGER